MFVIVGESNLQVLLLLSEWQTAMHLLDKTFDWNALVTLGKFLQDEMEPLGDAVVWLSFPYPLGLQIAKG